MIESDISEAKAWEIKYITEDRVKNINFSAVCITPFND